MRSFYALYVWNAKANKFIDCKYLCDRRIRQNTARTEHTALVFATVGWQVECWRPSPTFSSYNHRTRFFESFEQFFLLFPENKSCIHTEVTAVALLDEEQTAPVNDGQKTEQLNVLLIGSVMLTHRVVSLILIVDLTCIYYLTTLYQLRRIGRVELY